MKRPDEVTGFLRCGGKNCDGSCTGQLDHINVEDCKTWRVHGYVQQLEERISQLEASVPRWISVEERLPESKAPAYENDMNNAVLLYTPVDGYVHIGWYVRKDYRGRDVWHTLSAMRSQQTLTKKVTHWMPLPEPPKEE